MSRKEQLRSMIDSIIDGDEEAAAKAFSAVSYDIAREKLQINNVSVEKNPEEDE